MKYITFFLFYFFVLNVFSQNQISLKTEFPSRVKAGSTFDVKIIIEKPNIQNYAVFTQYFPNGFSVEEENSNSAIFKFKKQKLSYTWIRLPDDEKVIIYYKIKTDNKLKGVYKLDGKFIYFANNMKGSIYLDELTINVYQ